MITYHFPPDGSVGGLRWSGLSRYLARLGWEVHIITASRQSAASAPGVFVHYCAPRRTANDLYNVVMSRLRARRSQPSEMTSTQVSPVPSERGAGLPRSGSPVRVIRRNVAAALGFPDYGRGWILRAATRARSLFRERPFDALVSSGPPHSAHMAGVLASAGSSLVYWVDMRDPWAEILKKSWVQPFFNTELARWLIPQLERLAFRRAYRVVTNTAEFADSARSTYSGLRISHVPNGVDPDRIPSPSTDKYDGLSIAYAGTLYLGRDLGVVLQGIERFLAANADASGRVKLRVAGKMDAGHAERLSRDAAALGLQQVLDVRGELAAAEALEMTNRSHLALVLAQDQPMQVPAKIYECVGMEVPTLVIAEPSSAAAGTARRIGAATCAPEDVEAVRTIVEDLWRGRLPSRIPPKSAVDYHHIAREVDALLRDDVQASRRTT